MIVARQHFPEGKWTNTIDRECTTARLQQHCLMHKQKIELMKPNKWQREFVQPQFPFCINLHGEIWSFPHFISCNGWFGCNRRISYFMFGDRFMYEVFACFGMAMLMNDGQIERSKIRIFRICCTVNIILRES